MVEAVAEDGEMSVYVRRGAGKSYSDEGSLFFLEVVGVVLWACFSHCALQVVGILEGREESLWPVLCNPGLDEDTLTIKGAVFISPTSSSWSTVEPSYIYTHTPIHPSIHPVDHRLPFSSEFLRHDQGFLKRPIGTVASFQEFLGKSSILEPFLDGTASTSVSPCSVFPTHRLVLLRLELLGLEESATLEGLLPDRVGRTLGSKSGLGLKPQVYLLPDGRARTSHVIAPSRSFLISKMRVVTPSVPRGCKDSVGSEIGRNLH